MTQGEIEKLAVKTGNIFSSLEIRIMTDIVRRIREAGFATASAYWQISRLQRLGLAEKDIRGWIQEALKASNDEMEKVFSDEVYEQYYGHERAYKLAGMQQIPFDENVPLQQLIEAVKAQLQGEYRNISGSMGFAIRDPASGKLQYSPLMDYYRSVMDQAVIDIRSGAFDYNTVLKRTVGQMTASGIRYIDYDSGHRDRVDVAARRAILTGFRQVQAKINEQAAADLNTDQYEVSYHVGARPTHQPWQGKVWTKQELVDICGLGTGPGLLGWNCYHDYRPFPPGSVRTYTDEQLQKMLDEENTPKEYNGKQYTTYEALQQQRKMERVMRAQRQKIKLLEEGGADEQEIIAAKARYQGQMQTYKDFSEKMKLPEQKARIMQDGLRGKFMPTKAEIEKIQEPVVKEGGSDIMEPANVKEEAIMTEIQSLGKIDTKVLEKEFGKIQTDEIIVTNERIDHIKERHPEDYALFEEYGKESVTSPDLIIKDIKHEGTVFMVKQLPDTNLNVVVRVVLEKDDSKLKNSVMTFYRIRERNLKKLIEKNGLLYKKE